MLRQFGCDCGRCVAPGRVANTSASLLTLNEVGEVVHHILIDVGLGVVDSLRDLPALAGRRARLDWLLLTHWHPDHTLEMNHLLVSYQLNMRRRGQAWQPVPLWCRAGSLEWLAKEHSFDLTLTRPESSAEFLPPGRLLPPVPIGLAGLTITPFTVSHFGGDRAVGNRQEVRYSCGCFVVEAAGRKMVLLWDIDSENDWLLRPGDADQAATVQFLRGADHLFIDNAFWQPQNKPTTHPSFHHVKQIAIALQPQNSWLVHLSGHPDGPGRPAFGWTNDQWQTAAQTEWKNGGCPGRVWVPTIGQQLELS